MFSFFGSSDNTTQWEIWEQNPTNKCYAMDYYCDNYFNIEEAVDHPYFSRFGKFSYFFKEDDKVISELIHFYDSCKGYARYLTGDPTSITIIKNFLKTNNKNLLSRLEPKQYLYDTLKIHAYTVAVYSLSTLIMRIILHHLFKQGMIITEGMRCLILPEEKGYKTNIIGSIEIFNRCYHCQRLCDKIWGNYGLCLDCYHTKICHICGREENKEIPSTLHLPLCKKCS